MPSAAPSLEPIKRIKLVTKLVTKLAKQTNPSTHHDHTSELNRLNRIKGQVEGIEKMILEKRYCPEIVQQIKAIRAALKSLENNVIEGHIKHCLKTAIISKDPYVAAEKIEEILLLLKGQS